MVRICSHTIYPKEDYLMNYDLTGLSQSRFKDSQRKLTNLLAFLGLLVSFNNILIAGINISLIVFIYIFFTYTQRVNLIKISYLPQVVSIFFAVAAIISVLDVNVENDASMPRAIAVLPNFIYWALLIIVISNLSIRYDFLSQDSLSKISKYLTIGLVSTAFFYNILGNLSAAAIKGNTPNSYSFVLVCYSAIATAYISEKYNKKIALLFFGLLLASLITLERRAGFALVFSSGLLAIYLEKLNFRNLLLLGLFLPLFYFILNLNIVSGMLMKASPRIYESIYQTENIKQFDHSYLTRVAQIQKGFTIFEDNPLTGIGLNNFSNIDIDIQGNFEGFELIMNKELSDKSAHNSYIALLAEGGLFIVIPFGILLSYNFYYFLLFYFKRTKLENAIYFSFIAMCFHMYLISELYNVYAWFLIALVTSISLKYQRAMKTKRNR